VQGSNGTPERWTPELLDRFASTVAMAIATNNEAIAANAQAIAANAQAITVSNERMARTEETQEQLSAELLALSRDVSRLVDTVSAAAQERQELREATLGIANLLASLDSDRPTIFRKLNSIENKVDRLLES
jgi:phosphoglycerate dehydrogenase-like enzyme